MAAPFRINKPESLHDNNIRGDGENGFKEYLGRLLNLIPAEVVGVYMIGSGFIPNNKGIVLLVWSCICLGFVILVRIYGTQDSSDPVNKKPPQYKSVLISSISFIVWIYWLGGPFIQFHLHVPYIGSLAVLFMSFITPIIYKGD